MSEAKRVNYSRIIIGLTEEEAGRVKALLINHTCFDDEPWASDLYEALDIEGVEERDEILDAPLEAAHVLFDVFSHRSTDGTVDEEDDDD